MTILEKFQKLDHMCCISSDKLEYGLSDCDCSSIDEMVDILEDIEKALRALEIIKSKSVNTRFLVQCWMGTYCCQTYHDYINDKKRRQIISLLYLDEDEFNLLRDVFDWGRISKVSKKE